ncbi:MAG: hypothetical protein GX638_17585 [Crenarchaeota archaeon]|nr:hypothetical protein [Thermoproteota archaeon]
MEKCISEELKQYKPKQITVSRLIWKTSLFPDRTKLESFVDVLAAVYDPDLLCKKLNCTSVYVNKLLRNKTALDFLINLGLIKQNESKSETNINYYILQKGQLVLRYFKYFDGLLRE